MDMRIRNCAGGVVFFEDKVLILCNDKSEWVFPKGVLRGARTAEETALARILDEAGCEAEIICYTARTRYEFYSRDRRQPIMNKIIWYCCKADSNDCEASENQGFSEAGFYPIEEAEKMITYAQDTNLLRLAYNKYQEYLKRI